MCKVWSAVNSSDRQEYFCVVRALQDVMPSGTRSFELFGAVLLSSEVLLSPEPRYGQPNSLPELN